MKYKHFVYSLEQLDDEVFMLGIPIKDWLQQVAKNEISVFEENVSRKNKNNEIIFIERINDTPLEKAKALIKYAMMDVSFVEKSELWNTFLIDGIREYAVLKEQNTLIFNEKELHKIPFPTVYFPVYSNYIGWNQSFNVGHGFLWKDWKTNPILWSDVEIENVGLKKFILEYEW